MPLRLEIPGEHPQKSAEEHERCRETAARICRVEGLVYLRQSVRVSGKTTLAGIDLPKAPGAAAVAPTAPATVGNGTRPTVRLLQELLLFNSASATGRTTPAHRAYRQPQLEDGTTTATADQGGRQFRTKKKAIGARTTISTTRRGQSKYLAIGRVIAIQSPLRTMTNRSSWLAKRRLRSRLSALRMFCTLAGRQVILPVR